MYVNWLKPDVTGCEQVCELNSLSMALDKHTNFAWEHTQVCRH